MHSQGYQNFVYCLFSHSQSVTNKTVPVFSTSACIRSISNSNCSVAMSNEPSSPITSSTKDSVILTCFFHYNFTCLIGNKIMCNCSSSTLNGLCQKWIDYLHQTTTKNCIYTLVHHTMHESHTSVSNLLHVIGSTHQSYFSTHCYRTAVLIVLLWFPLTSVYSLLPYKRQLWKQSPPWTACNLFITACDDCWEW